MNIGLFDPLPFQEEPKNERKAPVAPPPPRNPNEKIPIGPTDI